MTMHPKKTARQWVPITMIPVVCLSAILLDQSADSTTSAASLMPGQIVFPRAGVSSDAYRTRSTRHFQPGDTYRATTQKQEPEPARLTHATSARQIESDSDVVPVQHQTVQPVGVRPDNRLSVRAELERLYAEEGRQLPQAAMPQVQPQPAAGATPAVAPHQALPQRTHPPQQSGGLLAGLFDFGRKNRSRESYSGMPMRPPAEPRPFRPPTYRQQQHAARTAQPQLMPQSQSPAGKRQESAQSTQSTSVFTLQKGMQAPSPRNFSEPADGFFPEDPQVLPTVSPDARAGNLLVEEDHDAFFPEDASAPPAGEPNVDVASNSMKARMNALLNSQPGESSDANSALPEAGSPFQMPASANEQIIDPPAAPAAVSEVVTTKVAPFVPAAAPTTNPREPAPFFAAGERAIDPQEDMDIAALTGQTFDPSGADSEQTAGTIASSSDVGSRMQQIAAREGVGLKGFCPVALRDERTLKDGRAAFVSFYRSKAYYFSSLAAKDAFDARPRQYAPAAGGLDLTMKTLTGEAIEGSLDHCVWYKDKLFLFHSAENLATFMAAPSAMAVAD